MKDNVYISTSALKDGDLERVLGMFLENGFDNIELGAGISHSPGNQDVVLRFRVKGVKFLIHNYFPRPAGDFVLNLASNDAVVLSKSIALCKCAIDLSSEIKAPFYSVHAGFAFHASPADLGRPQNRLPRIPYREAYKIFVDSVSELAAYASKRGVKLAVENNVVAKFNLTNGRNEILMLAAADEAASFYGEVNSSNLFFLIDLGHLKVTAKSLGFNVERYLDRILPHTIAFHLSDNDSIDDQHLFFGKKAWFSETVRENQGKAVIFESHCSDMEQVKACYKDLEGMFCKN